MLRRRLTFALLAALGCTLAVSTAAPAIAARGAAVTTSGADSVISRVMPAGGVFSAGTAWKLDVRDAPPT